MAEQTRNTSLNKLCDAGDYSVLLDNGTMIDNSNVCYYITPVKTTGIWKGQNPLEYSLPILILQLLLIILLTRLIGFLLKTFRQPRVIAEILGGIILGPSVLGKYEWFATTVFPVRSIFVLEIMANVGLLYFLFLVGLEMDLSVVRRTGKKSLVVALAGMGVPFTIAGVSSFNLMQISGHRRGPYEHLDTGIFILFIGAALSVTAFTVLARILAELKLLNAELGRLAISSAMVNDILAWIILALAVAISHNRRFVVPNAYAAYYGFRDDVKFGALWVILSNIVFVGISIFLMRPGIKWIIRKTPEGENVSESYILLILTGVMFCAFVTDAIGTHSIFGAFLFGLVIPKGPLASNLIDRLEDFLSCFMLPLFFTVSGLRTNLRSMSYSAEWIWLFFVIILCSLAKFGATFLAALLYEMPTSEAVALGLLMNTKGLTELIVLNVAREQKVFNDEAFALMVIVAVVTTAVIIPTVTTVYRPGGRFVPHKRRTIQKSKPDAELRLLVCIHSPRNVPSIIRILDISHPSKRSPIHVFTLQLVELIGRASAMLIVQNTRKSGRHPALNRTQAQSDQIVKAFENYVQNAASVSFQTLTSISPYSTMHEDICNLAEEKRVSLIIVPFHKQQTIDGGMEEPNPAYRTINQNILANAPCSLGILVDRGLGASSRATAAHSVVVLFFGGPDCREALAYALRMTDNPNIKLKVYRFIPRGESTGWSRRHADDSTDNDMLSILTDTDREKQMDEDSISDFRMKTADNESVMYIEKVANNGEEMISAIKSIDNVHDLYIIGRGEGTVSPLTAGFIDWSECPELGVIGDLLASADFALSVSVLVVQQYVGKGLHGDGVSSTDSPAPYQPGQQFERQSSSRRPTNNYGNGTQPWQQVNHH